MERMVTRLWDTNGTRGEEPRDRTVDQTSTMPRSYAISPGACSQYATTAAVLLLVACSGDDPDVWDPDQRPVPVAASDSMGAPAVREPVRAAISGFWIWVADAALEPALHLIDTRSKQIVWSGGAGGEAAGSFYGYPASLLVRPGDTPGFVWAWDVTQQRLTRFQPRSTMEYEPEVLALRGPTIGLGRVGWLSENEIIGVAGMTDSAVHRFWWMGSDGNPKDSAHISLPASPGVSYFQRLRAANQAIVLCPWDDRGFAVANYSIGKIELFDLGGNLHRVADVPFPSEPTYEAGPSGELEFKRIRYNYRSCAVFDDHLYALYSGRKAEELPGVGREVHIFNWNGELAGALKLDRDVNSITIDQRTSMLYAISRTTGRIFLYRIPAESLFDGRDLRYNSNSDD